MLLKESAKGKSNFWCFDESQKRYLHNTNYTIKKTSWVYNTKEKLKAGKVILLGPVCLGFWRG